MSPYICLRLKLKCFIWLKHNLHLIKTQIPILFEYLQESRIYRRFGEFVIVDLIMKNTNCIYILKSSGGNLSPKIAKPFPIRLKNSPVSDIFLSYQLTNLFKYLVLDILSSFPALRALFCKFSTFQLHFIVWAWDADITFFYQLYLYYTCEQFNLRSPNHYLFLHITNKEKNPFKCKTVVCDSGW